MGHLLCLAPTRNAQEQLQREISLANDHAKLIQLATVYLNNFICTFRRAEKLTPSSSECSTPLIEDMHGHAQNLMQECTSDRRSSRALALLRDDYHCMLTGGSERHGEVKLHAVCIIPQTTNGKICRDNDQWHHSCGMWAILSAFGYDQVGEDLAGNRIHCVKNILTLSGRIDAFFNDLFLWLKPVDGELNKYRLFVAKEGTRQFNALPEYVTFSTDTDIPLPDPKYLALHALCCEIAWMSGAIEYIMDMESRMEDSTVMANDGSSADLLMAALSLVDARGTGPRPGDMN